MRVRGHHHGVVTVDEGVCALGIDHPTQKLAFDIGPSTLVEIGPGDWTQTTVERRPAPAD